MKNAIRVFAFIFVVLSFACSKNENTEEDLAAKVVGNYVGSIVDVSGNVLVSNYRFSITKTGTFKEISIDDGTGAVSGFMEKMLITTNGQQAISGFLSAGQGGSNVPIASLTTLSGVKELIAILPEIKTTTNNILYDVKGATIIIAARSQSGVVSVVLAKKN